jgi:hypothetical protein
MKLLIFGVSVFYLLGLKMSTKMDPGNQSGTTGTTFETTKKPLIQKVPATQSKNLWIEKDSLILNKQTSDEQTAPTEKIKK